MSTQVTHKNVFSEKYTRGLLGFGLLGILAGSSLYILPNSWPALFGGTVGLTWFLFGLLRIVLCKTEYNESTSARARMSMLLLALYGIVNFLTVYFVHPLLPSIIVGLVLQFMIFLCVALDLLIVINPDKK